MNLKTRLIEMIKNDTFPNDVDYDAFSDELKEALKSTDGNLRDRLALNTFCELITSGKISDDKCRMLFRELISENYLLCGLGKECDDSVFARSFSTYPISSILEYNRQSERRILTDDDIKSVFAAAIKYVREEIDMRDFVDGKGWADSIGHGADFLASLAEDSALGANEHRLMLDTIRDKVCIDYVNHAHAVFRLAGAASEILIKGLLSESEFANWVAAFFKQEKASDDAKDTRLAYNKSEFFVGLYGRIKTPLPNLYPYAFDAFIDLIK